MPTTFNYSNYIVGISNDLYRLKKALNHDNYKESAEIISLIDRKIITLQEKGYKMNSMLQVKYDKLKKIAYVNKLVTC